MTLTPPSLLPVLLLVAGLQVACVDNAKDVGKSSGRNSAPLAPAETFDLRAWKLTLPELDPARGKAREIMEDELNGSGDAKAYSHPRWFYLDAESGAIVFKTPNHLATTQNSKNTRSELREMLRAGDTAISNYDPKNNWVIAAHPHAEEYGAVGGVLEATLAVDWVSTSGNDEKLAGYSVVVGQIHGSGKTEPLKIFYRKLPSHQRGSLFWNYESRPENEDDRRDVSTDVWGSHKLTSKDQEPEDGIALTEKFSYRVEVIEHEMRLTFERGDGRRVTHIQELAQGHADIVDDQGYSDDWMYFKAGAYNQCNLGAEGMWGAGCQNRGEEAGDYAQVRFFELSVSH